MPALSTAHPAIQPDDDPLLARLLHRCATASIADVWHLARAWTAPAERGGLVAAGLGLAQELGAAREVRAAMAATARALLESDGGRSAAARLHAIGIAFRAEAAAEEAALAVLLRDHLSLELGGALAVPWTSVFGDPLAPEPGEGAPPA